MILSAILTNKNARKFVRVYKTSEHEKGLSDLDHSKMYRQFITKGSNASTYTHIHIITYMCNAPTPDISHLMHFSSGPVDCSEGTVSG